jgi:hypothetical protein
MVGGRISKLLGECVEQFALDLGGLVVLTEAASGHYLYTPLLAALAGSQKVYAVAADSRFGSKEEVGRRTADAAAELGVADRVEVIYDKTEEAVAASDIITNTGSVRPIDRKTVSMMKPTAVVPLMWETWEFREGEVDLDACRERGILVMGTDESGAPLDMYPYGGYLAMKLLFEMGLEGHQTRTLLLGGGEALGRSIDGHFRRLRMQVDWFSDLSASAPYDQLPGHFARHGATYDAIILAEHSNPILLLGEGGLLGFDEIRRANPAVCVGVIAGNLDREGLEASGLTFFPRKIEPFGYMSYQAYHLGPRPVLGLYAAGLKAGQVMARARRSGASVEEAAAFALKNSPAMDFEGDRAWLKAGG